GGADAAVERRLRGRLDGRTVHHRVAVGQADLDGVAPGLDHHAHRLDGAVDRRVARGEVADEGSPVLGARPVEGTAGRGHCTASSDACSRSASGPSSASPRPNHSMAVPMSLSPRPLRLTITVASGPFSWPSRLATSSAPAIAWADSMAGMM